MCWRFAARAWERKKKERNQKEKEIHPHTNHLSLLSKSCFSSQNNPVLMCGGWSVRLSRGRRENICSWLLELLHGYTMHSDLNQTWVSSPRVLTPLPQTAGGRQSCARTALITKGFSGKSEVKLAYPGCFRWSRSWRRRCWRRWKPSRSAAETRDTVSTVWSSVRPEAAASPSLWGSEDISQPHLFLHTQNSCWGPGRPAGWWWEERTLRTRSSCSTSHTNWARSSEEASLRRNSERTRIHPLETRSVLIEHHCDVIAAASEEEIHQIQ